MKQQKSNTAKQNQVHLECIKFV